MRHPVQCALVFGLFWGAVMGVYFASWDWAHAGTGFVWGLAVGVLGTGPAFSVALRRRARRAPSGQD
ncbi:MAG TPA: hypothetical protein VGR13_03915 [Actinomycetota bacterium]|nr:hypothetical protein [Actinomycetota bacterium]